MSVDISASNKRIAKNTLFLYIRLVFVLLVSLYTVRVVLNALGIVDYGIYNVVGGFASMFGFFCTTMSSATQRFYNYEIGKNGYVAVTNVFNSAFRIQILFSIIVFVLGEIIGVWYINYQMVIPEERLVVANWIYQFALLSLIFTIIQVPFSAAIMAYERMNFYAIVGIIDAILKLLIAIIIFQIYIDRLWLYGFLLFMVSITNFVLYVYYCKMNFGPIKLVKRHDVKLRNEMLSFSGWNVLGTFSYMMRNQGLNVLINAFFGVVINAASGIAGQVSGALQTFTSNIVIAFKPQLTQAYAKGEYARTQQLFFVMSKISYTLMLVLAVPLILEMNYVLHLWLGKEVPEYTISFSILTVISILIGVFHTPIVQVLHATGKIKKFQIFTAVIILWILPLSWLFIKIGMSPNSIYWVTIAVFLINQIVGLWLLHKCFSYRYIDYIKEVILPCIYFTILLIIVPYYSLSLFPESFLRLSIICMEALIIGICLAFFIILNSEERKQCIMLVKKKNNKY